MESDLIAHVIKAVTVLVGFLIVFGFPFLAVVVVRFLKFKERELALDMEYRQKSQQQGLAIEQRVQIVEQQLQRLDEVLTTLDHDVRDRLGIGSNPATSLSSHPELGETPAASDAQREQSLEFVRTKARG
jgi:hypothetical protein